jgi:hypothetical protein
MWSWLTSLENKNQAYEIHSTVIEFDDPGFAATLSRPTITLGLNGSKASAVAILP